MSCDANGDDHQSAGRIDPLNPIECLEKLQALIDGKVISPKDVTAIEFQLIYGRERTDADMLIDNRADMYEVEHQAWFHAVLESGVVYLDSDHLVRLNADELRLARKNGRRWFVHYLDCMDLCKRYEVAIPRGFGADDVLASLIGGDLHRSLDEMCVNDLERLFAESYHEAPASDETDEPPQFELEF